MIPENTLIGIGTLVTYEDAANPLQLGTVIDVRRTLYGPQYEIAFHAQKSDFGDEYGLPSRVTVSSMTQHGWNLADDMVEEEAV